MKGGGFSNCVESVKVDERGKGEGIPGREKNSKLFK